MKTKLFVSILFAIIFINSKIYAQPYHPLLEENKYWDVLQWTGYDMNPICGYGGGTRYLIQGDTLINTRIYKKIFAFNFIKNNSVPDPYFCPPYLVDTIKQLTDIYLREDTTLKQVYYLDFYNNFSSCSNNNEVLLYDFSYLPGDTLKCITATWNDCNFLYKVDSINTRLIYGLNRKVIYFSGMGQDAMVEGIGGLSTGGLFQTILFFESGYYPDCVNYLGNSGCAGFISNIKTESDSYSQLTAYFDPSNKSIALNNINRGENISLFNLLGIELFSLTSNDNNMQINLSNVTKGIHVLKVGAYYKKILIY